MTTAEGGMLTTNDSQVAEEARLMRDQGKQNFFSNKIVRLGYSYRMSEIHAVLGLYQLDHIEEWIRRRSEIAQKYDRVIEEIPSLHPPFIPREVRHSFYKYVVYSQSREKFRKELERRGVSTSLHYDPLVHQQPIYRDFRANCPVAEKMSKCIFSLPLYNQMTDEEVDYVCAALKKIGQRV
jgi:perosamine synthetase